MLFRAARSGLRMGSWLSADVVAPWSFKPSSSRAPGAALWALQCCLLSTRTRFVTVPAAPAVNHLRVLVITVREEAVLEETQDEQEIISRVAALDIGKAELVCCVRVPDPKGGSRRVHEVKTYSTMTRSLQVMTRYRITLVSDQIREKNRVEKLFEDSQIKLSVVASDIFGVSGRDMMAALIGGESNPQVLAQMARSRMRAKIPQLEEAFVGHFTDHHRFLLTKMLTRIDTLNADIAELGTKIEAQLAPFADAVARLAEIPGVGATAAAVIIAEVGIDMTRFPTPAHLSSWARFAPGVKKAVVAVGRSILVIVWYLLSDPEAGFHDLGPGYYDSRINPERKKRNHVREPEALGYRVTLQPAA